MGTQNPTHGLCPKTKNPTHVPPWRSLLTTKQDIVSREVRQYLILRWELKQGGTDGAQHNKEKNQALEKEIGDWRRALEGLEGVREEGEVGEGEG